MRVWTVLPVSVPQPRAAAIPDKGPMPSFQGRLTGQNIADIAPAWVL